MPVTAAPIWVVHDTHLPAQAPTGIAERLGAPILRLGLGRPFAGPPPGAPPPRLVISAGLRGAGLANWLRLRFGTRAVHCLSPGTPPDWARAGLPGFGLVVAPFQPRPLPAPLMAVRCLPTRMSPLRLRRARAGWAERLAHLPHPRIALLVGGPDRHWLRGAELRPDAAYDLGRTVTALAIERRGCVLALTMPGTGHEAEDALAAGLATGMHLLHRANEPGENPHAAFLATADAVVAPAASLGLISEACATEAPVFYAKADLASPRQLRALAVLHRADLVRPFQDMLSPWPRQPIDEAGRVAAEITRLFGQIV